MSPETLLRSIVRLQTAEAFLSGPGRHLISNDLSPEGRGAYDQILAALGKISAVLMDLDDARRNQQPMYVRSAV